MFKKIFAGITAFVMAGSLLAGCGSDTANEDFSADEYAEITVGGGLMTKLSSNRMGKFLEDKAKIRFKIINMEGNDAIRLMAATNDLPNLIGVNMDNLDYQQFAEDGLIRDVPESILKDYQFCKKDNDDNPMLQMFNNVLGKAYGVARADRKDGLGGVAIHSIYYRADWANKLGITKQPETVDDMYDMYKAFTTRDPDGNGLPDTFGISGHLWQVHYIPWVDTYGWVKEKKKDTGEERWVPGFYSDAVIDGIKYWNRMYNEGILDKEFALNNSNPSELFFSNKVGVMYTNANVYWLNEKYTNFKTKMNINTDEELYSTLKIIAPGPRKDKNSPAYWPSYENTYVTAFGASVSDAKLKRILSLLNFMKSDEGILMNRFGFDSGVDGGEPDYKMVNGKPVSNLPRSENGTTQMLWEKYEGLGIFSFGILDDEWDSSDDNKTYPDAIKKLFKEVETKYVKTKFPHPVSIKYMPTPLKGKFNYGILQIEADFDTIVSQSPEEAIPAYEAFRKKLRDTYEIEKMIDEVNQIAKDKGYWEKGM